MNKRGDPAVNTLRKRPALDPNTLRGRGDPAVKTLRGWDPAEKCLGVYVHVPFCGRKCPYCDFFSVSRDPAIMDLYTDRVCGSVLSSGDLRGREINTVYFGGGTPSLLGSERIEKILRAVRETAGEYYSGDEITVEVNPGGYGPEFFRGIAKSGVNRISVGLQSAVPEELAFLGRVHSVRDAENAVKEARAAGILNISLDLMTGLPGQSLRDVLYSLDYCAYLPVTHLSVYMLKIEEGTPFAERGFIFPEEDEICEIYLRACEHAESLGFFQYEISNFAKPGFECRHNLRYWRSEDYLGFGPAAHSCINGRRHYIPADLETFLAEERRIDDGPAGGFAEYAMLALRLKSGLDLELCARKFGTRRDGIMKKARELASGGLLEINGDIISLTREGFLLSNRIIGELVL